MFKTFSKQTTVSSQSFSSRALKSYALSVTVTRFGLLSRNPATHCISHAEKDYYINFFGAPLSLWKRQETSASPMSLSRVWARAIEYTSLLSALKTWEPCSVLQVQSELRAQSSWNGLNVKFSLILKKSSSCTVNGCNNLLMCFAQERAVNRDPQQTPVAAT